MNKTTRTYTDPSAAYDYAAKVDSDPEVYRVIVTPRDGKHVVEVWRREVTS